VDESPDQIENHIRSTRRTLGSNLEELENRLKDATDWRVQFGRHPAAFLGTAFAVGALLSIGLSGRRPPQPEPPAARPHRHPGAGPPATGELGRQIATALVGVAASQIGILLARAITDFRRQRKRAATDKAPDPEP
jgi:hypothetical protein